MPTKKNDSFQEWLGTVLKSLTVCLVSLGVYVFNTNFSSLNGNLKELTQQLKTMEQHQVETDKRVAAIEVSREINMAGYQKVLQDITEMKQGVVNLTLRIQTIADFVANNFPKNRVGHLP